MIRCAIYIRVSTEEQVIHGLSIETQKDTLTEYAKDNNFEIVDYYIDSGKTARKGINNRLELQRLLEDVKNNKIDLIIFTKLDRWFRNVRDYHKVQEILEDNKVHWKTVLESYDTSTSNGRLHINIMLSVAQDEADRTSERIKVVFQNKLKNGEAISGSLPLGYKILGKKVVIDEKTTSIAKDIFDLYYYYQSQTRVLKEIINKYNINLCDKTIYRILHNKIYIGEYRGHTDFCEPLINKDYFYKIQEIMKNRNIPYVSTNRIFLFTGLIRCKECNHKMVANAQIRNRKSGKVEYILYKCNQFYIRKLCTHNKVIYENKIEKYLLENIKNEIKKIIYKYELEENAVSSTPKINKTQIKRKLEKLKELYINDLIDIEMYKTDFDKYTELLNTKIETEKKRDLQPLKDFYNTDIKSLYRLMTKEEKRILWRTVVKEIVIDSENKIKIIPLA
ncbi:recombinase family protein [Clostridium saccharoperbutylacetonicum]|uniref:recombinase family protein n=1 Tax=Clostridium saccharoperbutylacetonicum TaxID=36745 RepID=UPI0039ED007C